MGPVGWANKSRLVSRRVIGAGGVSSIAWPAEIPRPDLVRLVRVAVPCSSARFSKNRMYGLRGRDTMAPHENRRFIRSEVRAARDALALEIKHASRDLAWPQRKTYLDILVQLPNHKSDAINVVDVVADAVVAGTGVDDRWFCISRLEWEMKKDKPMLYVGIGQDGLEHQKLCPTCGRVLPLTMFRARGSLDKSFADKPWGRHSSHRTFCLECRPYLRPPSSARTR